MTEEQFQKARELRSLIKHLEENCDYEQLAGRVGEMRMFFTAFGDIEAHELKRKAKIEQLKNELAAL